MKITKIITIIILLLLVGVIVGLCFKIEWTNKDTEPQVNVNLEYNNIVTEEKLVDTDTEAEEEIDIREEEEPDETADWETYESEKLGISLKYPDGTVIVKESNSVIVDSWTIRVYSNNYKKNLKDWFDSHFDKANNPRCRTIESNIKVGEYQTILISGTSMGDCNDGGYFAISDNKLTIVKLGLGHDPAENFTQILSTFKFIE